MTTWLALQIWGAGIVLYFVPWLTAYLRHVPNTGSVAVVNAFTGFTGVGWVIALAMACRSRPAVR